MLGGYALTRRRARSAGVVLQPGMVSAAGVALYGSADAILLMQGLDAAALGGMRGGSGQWWSAGAVAAVVAVAYGRSACRILPEFRDLHRKGDGRSASGRPALGGRPELIR